MEFRAERQNGAVGIDSTEDRHRARSRRGSLRASAGGESARERHDASNEGGRRRQAGQRVDESVKAGTRPQGPDDASHCRPRALRPRGSEPAGHPADALRTLSGANGGAGDSSRRRGAGGRLNARRSRVRSSGYSASAGESTPAPRSRPRRRSACCRVQREDRACDPPPVRGAFADRGAQRVAAVAVPPARVGDGDAREQRLPHAVQVRRTRSAATARRRARAAPAA